MRNQSSTGLDDFKVTASFCGFMITWNQKPRLPVFRNKTIVRTAYFVLHLGKYLFVLQHLKQSRTQNSNKNLPVTRNSNVMFCVRHHDGQSNVAASLSNEAVTKVPPERLCKIRPRQVPREPHTAITSSLTRCSLTTGGKVSSSKWQRTASLTIAFRSSQSSPWVKIL